MFLHSRRRSVPDLVRIILLLLAVPTFLLPSLVAAQTENVPTGSDVVFSHDSYSMHEREDEQARVHTITVKAGPNAIGGVSWALFDGGAQRGTDYEPVTKEGVIRTGISTTHEIKIKIIDDDLVEPLETFYIRLSNPTGNATFPGGKTQMDAIVEIADNDQVSITVDPVTVTEGDSAQFHLKLGRVFRTGEFAQVFVSTGRYDKGRNRRTERSLYVVGHESAGRGSVGFCYSHGHHPRQRSHPGHLCILAAGQGR